MSNKLSIEELLRLGIPLEEILATREVPPVKITIDTDDLAVTIARVAEENKETLSQIKNILSAANKTNSDFMLKTAQMLIRQSKEHASGNKKEIKGLDVIRDELNLITRLLFIY